MLIDEKTGRQIARREGLKPLGLGGVLIVAKEQNLIMKVRPFLKRLEQEAGFYLSDEVKNELLKIANETD